jgi:hypothetical protein
LGISPSIVVGEGVRELLLPVTVLGDRGGTLDQLTEVVVEVDRVAGLVGEGELEEGEPKLARRLVAGEDHVGHILADPGVEVVEDGVVVGGPRRIRGVGGGGVVDVADETGAADGGFHVDAPLGVVGGVEGEDDERIAARHATSGKGASREGDEDTRGGVEVTRGGHRGSGGERRRHRLTRRRQLFRV